MPRWAGLTQAQALRPARQPASPAHARVCGGGSLALRALKVLGGHWAGSRQVTDGETERAIMRFPQEQGGNKN